MKVVTMADLERAEEFLVTVAKGSHDAVVSAEAEHHEGKWRVTIDLWVVVDADCEIEEVKDVMHRQMGIAARIFETPAGVQLDIAALVRREGAEGDAYESAWRLGGEAGVEALEALKEQGDA